MEKPQFNAKVTPAEVKQAIKKDAENLKNRKKRNQKIKEATEQETEQKTEKTEKVAESNEPAKEKKAREVKPAEFPVDAKINDYGFLHFGVGVLKALGWSNGIAVKISKNPDGSITVRKV